MEDGKAAVVLTFGVAIASNILSFTGFYGEGGIGGAAGAFPTYINADGITFAIWAVIYLLQFVLVWAQWAADAEAEALLSQRCPITGLAVRWRLSAVYLLNALWLPVFSKGFVQVAFVIIVAYLVVLISIVTALNTKASSSFCQWLQLVAPNVIHCSWLTAANAISLFSVLGRYGWVDENGVAGTARAGIVAVFLLAALGSVLAVQRLEVAWSLVTAWALAGVNRNMTGSSPDFPAGSLSPELATAAKIGSAASLLAAMVGLGILVYNAWQREAHKPVPLPQA